MSRVEENRKILQRLTPHAALSLPAGPHPSRVTHERSRNGSSTLRLQDSGGGRYLHSRYNPLKEAGRLAEQQEGFLVILGFGCGYFSAAAARRPEVAAVLAVEPVEEVLAVVAREAELSHLEPAPEKLRLLQLRKPRELADAVAGFYVPALHEKLSLHVSEGYDSLTDLSPFRDAFREGVARAAGNYRTMARLGRGWSRNIITNAAVVASGTMPGLGLLGPPKSAPSRAVVLGAGPGLEEWIRGGGAAESGGALLLAADTALPALISRGVVPDVVASIDSQAATYLHYMPPAPSLPGLIMADLTAPPALTRLGRPVGLFSGGHPLSAILLPETPVPGVSTEGGNVGFTLLSAAAAFKAPEITVAGIDYAYLRGRSYARGSYLDHYFLSRARRTDPLTNQWSRILYRDPEFRRIPQGPPWSYEDPQLSRFARSFDGQVTALEDAGVVVRRWSRKAGAYAGRLRKEGAYGRRREFAGNPRSPEALPTLIAPAEINRRLNELSALLSTPLSEVPRPLWMLTGVERALLPLLAWCREHPNRYEGEGFDAAREITLEQLARLSR